jgi:proteasome alpha subunit
LTINYDGTFEEKSQYAVLAATSAVEQKMAGYLREQSIASLEDAVGAAIRTWAVGDRAQRRALDEGEGHDETRTSPDQLATDAETLYAYLRRCRTEKTVECALLDRQVQGPSKYRALGVDELKTVLPKALSASLS